MKKDFTAIVLAAGKGKRMKSNRPKVLCELMGQPLIYYVVSELLALKKHVTEIRVIVGHKADEVTTELKNLFSIKNGFISKNVKVKFVHQINTLGTAHAVSLASKNLRTKNALVLCGDAPLIKANTLSKFISFYLKKSLDAAVLTAFMQGVNSLGIIVRDEKEGVKAIKEKVDFSAKYLKEVAKGRFAQEINSGIYCFSTKVLQSNLKKIKRNKRKKEYFLTDLIEIIYNRGKRVDSYSASDSSEVLGVNTQKDLILAQKALRGLILDEHIEAGVKVIDPDNTFIEKGVRIGKNTTIYPFTFIEKGVIIGNNCALGPFVRLRKGTVVGDDVCAGNFLELNRSYIGKGTRIKHFGYLGDTVVADKVNIGAGTVVANFDGQSKNKTFIESGAFIGCDTVLVSPLKVGKGAVTGAGSVVTKNVESNTVVVGVPAKLLKKKKRG